MDKREQERIAALKAYQVLDTPAEKDLDDLVSLASEICQTPIALITLIDENRQWFKANKGLSATETPRNVSFCQHAIKGNDIYEVDNATTNPLFSDNPFVTGSPNVRFYAGAPLTSAEGYNVGTLCVIDMVPKTLTEAQRTALRTLSRMVIRHFELRKLHHETEETKKTFQSVLDNTDSVIGIKDMHMRYVLVNKKFAQLFGFTQKEILFKTDHDIRPAHIADKLRATDEQVIREKRMIKFEQELETANGKLIFYVTKFPIYNEEGHMNGFCFMATDITQRKEAEIRLREQDEKFSKIFHSSPVAMSLGALNPNRFIEINESFARLTGYSQHELIGRNLAEAGLADEAERNKLMAPFAEQGYLRNVEITIRDKNHHEKCILLSTELIDINGQQHSLSVYYDITGRKQLEKQLLAAKELAEESGKAKEQFLANMSHEIRTPMNAVLGFTDLLSETRLSATQQEYVQAIGNSGRSLMTIINDVLDYSKIEAGMLTIDQVPMSIRSIFSSLAVAFKDLAGKKKLKLAFHSDKKIPEVLTGDPGRLTQIITNLVGNALKFTAKGSVTVEATLVKKAKDRATVAFSISDTGIGIPRHQQSSVFERFNQGRNDTTRNYGGTGLGLSIVKKLAELQGGSVTVKSTPGKGSAFTVLIPYSTVVEEDDKAIESQAPRARPSFKPSAVSVLIVEDNRLNQKLAEKILGDLGFKTEIADNGKIAVDKLKASDYDLVLMDMQMPEMNGYEATQAIRQKLKKTVPIIAMTAHAMASERDRCIGLGMNDYISKPFKKDDLYRKILEALTGTSKDAAKKAASKKKAVGPLRVLNLVYLTELSGGNEEFMKEVLEIFVAESPGELQKLDEAIREKDYATVRNIAHKLKSALMLTGMDALGPLFNDMENLAESRKGLPRIRAMFAEIGKTYMQAIEEARDLI